MSTADSVGGYVITSIQLWRGAYSEKPIISTFSPTPAKAWNRIKQEMALGKAALKSRGFVCRPCNLNWTTRGESL